MTIDKSDPGQVRGELARLSSLINDLEDDYAELAVALRALEDDNEPSATEEAP